MSEIQFRPMVPEELPQFRRLIKYAFAGDAAGDDPPDPLRPEWSLCAFDGERMVASSGAYPFKIRFNGATLACAGVTGVAADPGYRRQGLVRELMTRTLYDQHRLEVPAAILWASMGAIYQRFGYGLASNHVTYEFDPRFAEFREEIPSEGSVRLMSKEEAMPVLSNLYRRYCRDRNLLVHRVQAMWDTMIPEEGKRIPHIAVYHDAGGEPTAYAVYHTMTTGSPTGTGPWQDLRLVDLVWLDIGGYRAMWEYLRRHDLVRRMVWTAVPEDDPATGLLLEPRLLNKRVMDGIWMRVIDARATLAARRYFLPAEVVVEVAGDEICPWNDGCYRIACSGTDAEVERLAGAADPDLTIDPNGLSSLVTGHTTASFLARIGRASRFRAERLPLLDSFFATTYRPTCANDF